MAVIWSGVPAELGLVITAQQDQQLQQYVELLLRWNQVYNLTAVRDPAQMLPLHLWDSLSIVPFIEAESCLDVGSGAGLPGIPLAIMRPKQYFFLLDTNGKKTRFIQQATLELGLTNIKVIQRRVEQWQPKQQFAAIISRAFASLADFVTVSGQHLQVEGKLYAMKGRYPETEIAELPQGWHVAKSHPLSVPGVNAERHLLELIRTA